MFILSCSTEDTTSVTAPKPVKTTPIVIPPVIPPVTQNPTTPITKMINYLALGDSYTIGQSVCETCRFPEQLASSLKTVYTDTNFSLKVIATTGWTTTNLISAIESQKPEPNYDLVTLLIGVNNQYQGKEFSIYEKEFPELVTKAIILAKGDKRNLIVVSIPDYAYTPFAQNSSQEQKTKISREIDQYNTFAQNYCENNGIVFVSITDITRQGLNDSKLVASDGLHPSEYAYKLFVDRMINNVKKALQE